MLTTLLVPICLSAAPQMPEASPATTTKTTASSPHSPQFHPPVRMQAGKSYVQVESPGYAAPCWADVDGDRRKDLIVGQFNGGKMKVYRNRGKGRLAEGEWLEADGQIAEVPGVW